MIAAIAAAGPWAWIIAGLLLMAVELLAPGLFFIWLGLAALATGAAVALFGLGWTVSSMLFAALSVLAVLAARWLTRRRADEPDNAAHLNTRARDLIGRTVILDEPISRGRGRIRIGDTVWRAEGEDCEAGLKVRIVGLDGTALKVERA